MLLPLIELFDQHRLDNKRVKDDQKEMRLNHPLDLLVWIWDFKGSLKVGKGAEVTAEEERNQSMVNLSD